MDGNVVTDKPGPRVEHHFDFGSPNCYFAHRVIGAIESRTGATFVYTPILLGGVFKATGNRPPLIAFGDVANKLAYERLEIKRSETERSVARGAFGAPTFIVADDIYFGKDRLREVEEAITGASA